MNKSFTDTEEQETSHGGSLLRPKGFVLLSVAAEKMPLKYG
jgi:hypothetical protein